LQEVLQATLEGQELVREVWGVVSDYYLDARDSGFDRDKWAALRDKYLAQPLPTHEAAYRCACKTWKTPIAGRLTCRQILRGQGCGRCSALLHLSFLAGWLFDWASGIGGGPLPFIFPGQLFDMNRHA
jgi:hypothetical protein